MENEVKDELFEKYFIKMSSINVRCCAYVFDKILWRELPTQEYIRLMKLIDKGSQFEDANELIRTFYEE